MEQLTLSAALGTMRIGAPRRAPVVDGRTIIPVLQAAGFGPTAIARQLNTLGAATPSGRGRWHTETVTRHSDPGYRLRNAAYMRAYRARRRPVG